jgi:carboxymethylenebutenolidase
MSKIAFKRPDGKECAGYLVEPKTGASAPGIVVIQEWWGLNEQIKGVAKRYAALGYRALVPDLYRGKIGVDAKEAEHLMTGLDFGAAAGLDVRGAVQHLKHGSKKVGVTGYCMGGALTLLAAVNVPELDAASPWYGYPPLEYVDATKIKVPLLGHFAIHDHYFPIAGVADLERKLDAAGVRYEFHRYDAQHAFANESPPDPKIAARYDPKATDIAWKRTVAFFDKHLRA